MLNVVGLSVIMLNQVPCQWRHDIQHNDIQHNDAQHTAEHCCVKCQLCSAQFMVSVTYNAQCHYAECCYPECRGALFVTVS
jgi:hypothetical protein